jgi:hypothetical protein
MPIELRWIASASASCFHAAEAQAAATVGESSSKDAPRAARVNEMEARLADGTRSVPATMSGPVANLAAAVQNAGLPRNAFWEHLIAISATLESNRQLAERVLIKTIGKGARQESLVEKFSGHLTDVENAYNGAHPSAVAELELRSAPLREHWEARGLGLLHQVGKLTEPEFVVPAADVLLVLPVLGGAGAAHLLYNSVRIEAVLANPWPQLPEVVRLGWLLSQLNLDLPKHQGELNRAQVARLGALALVPIVLAASEIVELARCDVAALTHALEVWRLASSPQEAASVAAVLDAWWQVYRDTRPAWPVGLAALDQMLAATAPASS